MAKSQGEHGSTPNLFQPMLQRQTPDQRKQPAGNQPEQQLVGATVVDEMAPGGATRSDQAAGMMPGRQEVVQNAADEMLPTQQEQPTRQEQPGQARPQQAWLAQQSQQGQAQAQQSQEAVRRTQEQMRQESMYQQPKQTQNDQPQQQVGAPQASHYQAGAQQASQQQTGASQVGAEQAGVQQPAFQQQPTFQQQPAYQQSAFQQQPANQNQQQPAYQQPPYPQQPAYASAPQVIYTAPPQKKSRSWIVIVVLIVCLFAFTAFCVKTCSDSVSSAGLSGITSGPATDSVAIINIDGTIQYDGSANSPEGLKMLLDRAAENDKIKAVVLRVNSGGGVATAGEEMTTYLKDFKKPVVVSSGSINASAAYELSSQADYIYVAKSTEIGAIGTAMQLTDLSGLLDMLGINMEVLTSAESKDSSYGYRPLTDEEREYYQHMINQINETFIQSVADGRHMTVDQVRELATGLPFTGIDAVENGLADDFGTLEDAADKAASLAGISSYEMYDLAFIDYDFSSLSTLLGSSNDGEQKALPLLKQ